MAPDTSFSPEDLDNLTKPLAKNYGALLKKVSNAAGILYEPFHVRRMAKARGQAALTEAEHETARAEVYRRAEHRRREEDARHQKNMEDILEKALPRVDEDSDPNSMDNDWTANFIEKCRIVSDDEMQDLWARVLAGEANAPDLTRRGQSTSCQRWINPKLRCSLISVDLDGTLMKASSFHSYSTFRQKSTTNTALTLKP